MQNSSNSTRNRITFQVVLALALMIGSSSAVSGDDPPDIKYIESHRINALTGCDWLQPCLPGSTDVNHLLYHARETERYFDRWRDIYVNSKPKPRFWTGRRNRSAALANNSWKPSPESDVVFHIRIPDGSSPKGALLLQTQAGILVKVFFKPRKYEETEYQPLNELTVHNYKGRSLKRPSRSKIHELTGCGWGEVCDMPGEIDLNRFLLERRDELFPRWEREYKMTTPKTKEVEDDSLLGRFTGSRGWVHLPAYSWKFPGRDKEYYVALPNLSEHRSAILIETTSGKLTGAFRMRSDRTEQEFRPLLADPELPLSQYRSQETWRRKRSSHHEDLEEVRYEFLTTDALHRSAGVSWGMNLSEIQDSRLLRGYQLVDPRRFFKPLAELQPSDWYLPDWDASRRDTNESSWLKPKEERVFLYRRSNSRFLRLLVFAETNDEPHREEAGLQRIYEYSEKGRLRIVCPPEQQSLEIRSRKLPRILGVRDKHTWGSSLEDLKSLRIKPYRNPGEFFQVRGQAFAVWAKKFANAKPHQIPRGDGSWNDSEGNRYLIFADESWTGVFGRKPTWYILEYHRDEPAREERLAAIHHFDSTWTLRTYVPHIPAPFAMAFGTRTGKTAELTRRWSRWADSSEIIKLKKILEDILKDYEEAPVQGTALLVYLDLEILKRKKRDESKRALADSETVPLPETRVSRLIEAPDQLTLAVGAVLVLLLLLALKIKVRRRRKWEQDLEDARHRSAPKSDTREPE